MGSKFGAGVVAGLVATLVMTILLYLAPLMGLPEMNIPGMLGTMFASPGTGATVLGLHFMMGAILALIYAYGFQAVPLGTPWLRGALYGVLPYLVAMIVVMPMLGSVHPLVKSGMMPAPGFFMVNLGGMAAVGSLIGHLVYGAVLGALYAGWAPAAQRTAPA